MAHPTAKIQARRFDPVLAARARTDFANRGREAGLGHFNRGMTGLSQIGGLRSGLRFGLSQEASQVEGDFAERLNLPFAMQEQDFTESARRFDTSSMQAARQEFHLEAERKRKNRFNPFKALVDIGKFAIPFIPGVGPAAKLGLGALTSGFNPSRTNSQLNARRSSFNLTTGGF